ncbi:MAG: peptidylprolyl isomerase [Candidatus Omnitrophica bacterium]|nr:peptidylprolyl isomerase [Candidatus Omnitrophota bacterium]
MKLGSLFLFFALSLLPAGSLFADDNRIVAVVNDEVITQSQLNRALAPVYLQLQATLGPEELNDQMQGVRQKVLEQLIEERLMLQEARQPRQVEVGKGRIGIPHPIEAPEREVEEMVAETRARFSSEQEFTDALASQGLVVEDLRSRFKDQLTIQKLISREVRSRVTVSPAEVTQYYEQHKEEFVTPPAVQVATILIRPKDSLDISRCSGLAQELHRQLLAGADFYELAKRYSDGFNAQMGGRMGPLERGKSRKEIDDVLFKLKAGEISPVIKTAAGFHIFLVESERPPRQAQLPEVQADILYKLRTDRGTVRYKEWIRRLRADSYIALQ